jgi:glycosyltransferase involved in cell wall biosynthesis
MSSKSVCLIVTAEITATTFYRNYLAYLRSAGWDVSLIASSDGNLGAFGRSEGIHVVDVPMRREPSPVSDVMSLIRLFLAIKKLRPEVVVTATPKAGLLGTIAARMARVPVRVYQLWGLRFETETGVKRSVLKTLESWSIGFSTQVVANSASLARRARDLGLMGRTPVVVLGPGSSHGVDLDRFSSDAEIPPVDSATSNFIAHNPAALVVGFVGRVHPDKGIHTLLEALEICRQQGLDLRLLVVGAFESDRVVADLRQSAIATHLVGGVADTRPYLQCMDIHCLPTRREGFPNVVLEAGAMGLVTIASDATGAVDSVINGHSGLLFRTDDSHDLAAALELLGSKPELRRRLGAQARAHVQATFSREVIWGLQERYLTELLGRRSSREE